MINNETNFSAQQNKHDLQSDGHLKEQSLSSELNELFRQGCDLVDASELLRQLPNPILVDFNNVLVNNGDTIIPNPDALAPFQELKKIGTVIIITTSDSWEAVHALLQKFGYWSDDVILIASPSYEELMKKFPQSQKVLRLQRDFMDLAKQHQLFNHPQMEYLDIESDYLWRGAVADKKVAYTFMKPYLIPLIDNSRAATENNPGILGIKVTSWEGRYQFEDPTTLSDALELVKKHYAQLPKEDTLERLYVLNEIRNILHQNADELEKRSVVRALGFGSVIKGSATIDSDIDICFLINVDKEESAEKTYQTEKFLMSLFAGLTFPPTEIFFGQENKKRTTHVTMEYVRTQNPENPPYIEDAMVLWEANK